MAVEISLLNPEDIPAAIRTIQISFVDDPFADFIYDPKQKSLSRNAVSLGIRLRWGIANGLVLVAHTAQRRCAGVAMWVPPKPLGMVQNWWEWYQGWLLWIQQLGMNLWYGRGGLRVDVPPLPSCKICFVLVRVGHLARMLMSRGIGYGKTDRRKCKNRFGRMKRDTGS